MARSTQTVVTSDKSGVTLKEGQIARMLITRADGTKYRAELTDSEAKAYADDSGAEKVGGKREARRAERAAKQQADDAGDGEGGDDEVAEEKAA